MPEASSAPSAPFPGNIEIAQRASMRPIVQLAGERLGIPEERLEPYGHYKAKVALDYVARSEEHTSELQSRVDLVCRLLLEKKKKQKNTEKNVYMTVEDDNTRDITTLLN